MKKFNEASIITSIVLLLTTVVTFGVMSIRKSLHKSRHQAHQEKKIRKINERNQPLVNDLYKTKEDYKRLLKEYDEMIPYYSDELYK